MIRTIFKPIFPLLALTLMVAACDDDDYQAGAPTPAESVSPYFPSDVASFYAFTPEDNKTIAIPVKRMKTDKAQTLKIVASGNDNGYFAVPDGVTFEAGQSEATLTVDCEKMPPKQECSLKLSFEDSQRDPYVEGFSELDLTAITSTWTLYGTDVYTTYDNNPCEASEIYILEGSRQFKITNFIGSTLDLIFTCGDTPIYPWGDESKAYAIFPTKNAFANEWSPDYWYFYDEDNDDWPAWSYDGVTTPGISYFQVYSIAEDEGYFYTYFCPYYESYEEPGTFYGFMQISGYANYDDDSTGYPWVSINFTPLFNPNL